MTKKKEKDLVLDLDSFWGGDYFYTKFDQGNEGHSITIKPSDKDKFIEAFLEEVKGRLESDLVEEGSEDDE